MSRRRLSLIVCLGVLVAFAGCAGVSGGDATPAPDIDPTPTSTPAQNSSDSQDPTTDSSAVNGTLEVHFINVEQSVATLLITPSGETMLIDTGDFNDDGEHVLRYLKAHDIDRIDHLVVSHNDADHIGGNAAVIEYYETEADGIGAIYDPGIAASTQTYESYLDAVEDHDVTLYETREGDALAFGGDKVDTAVLGPPEPYLASEARNENSIVLRVRFGETTFLFTGDAESQQEAYLVGEYGDDLDATVLKAGHHGSSTSTGGPLLDAADPQAVLISSAYDSRYDHPHDETLRRLADRDIPTYWTATHGDVVLVSNGTAVQVRTEHAAPTDPLALRDGEPDDPTTIQDPEPRGILYGSGESTLTTPASTPTPTPVPDGGTQESGGELTLVEVNADAEGNDNENLNDEYVVFENTGDETLDLSGWTVEDEAEHTYRFPDGFTLDPGDRVTVRTGSGTDTDIELYWGRSQAVWNNGGDTVIVTTADGERVIAESY